jgi:acyl-CoA synthetase (NDP forming)
MMEQVPKLRPQARLSGVSIQEMCRRAGDQEVILGVKRDPGFGPLLMFGLGGVLVEVLKDVAFALAPLTESDARALVRRVRSYPLLEGVRGQPGVDMDALVEGLLRLSQLVSDFPPIRELDINPLVVRPAGHPPVAVDARISVEADPRRRDPDAGLRPGENGAHDARPQAQSTSSDSCLKAK